MLTLPPTEKGLLHNVSGRGWMTIFATAQPSPTEKKLLRDAGTAACGEEPALRCERKGLEDYLCNGTAVAYGEETAS